jgi:large subunit ribosomal protein L24
MHIRVGDLVLLITGDEKGKSGTVESIDKKRNRAIVKNCNLVTRKIKRSENNKGQEIKKEAKINISNLAFLTKDKKKSRVGFRFTKDGKKERFAKKTGEKI